MSKMGNVIVDIQELALNGIPNEQIAKMTKTSLDFVDRVVYDLFEWDGKQTEGELEDV